MSNVWFITGCSSGLGQALATSAIAHGDTVVATARQLSTLASLTSLGATTLMLDVTATDAEIEAVVAAAIKKHDHIDILVNNAGVVLEGAIEESSDKEVKANFNVNVFGVLAVTRAVLPYMRARKSGTIAGIGSLAGWKSGAGGGIYCAAKFALVGIFEALREEVRHLGIEVVLIEPGYFRTKLLAEASVVSAEKRIADLEIVMGPARRETREYDGLQPGDPVKGAQVIVEVLTRTGRCAEDKFKVLPLRLLLGSDCVAEVESVLKQSKDDLEVWRELSVSTDFPADS
jgi:NADP-dependent 3-hydroxy acid dehydrogenase YdfG